MRNRYCLSIVLTVTINLSSNTYATDSVLDAPLEKTSKQHFNRESRSNSNSSTEDTSTASTLSHESEIPEEEFFMNPQEGLEDPISLNILLDAKFAEEEISSLHKSRIGDAHKGKVLSILCLAGNYMSGESFLRRNIKRGLGLYMWVAEQKDLGSDWFWQVDAMDKLREISEDNKYQNAATYWVDRSLLILEDHKQELEQQQQELALLPDSKENIAQ